jgi:hypothetical protein
VSRVRQLFVLYRPAGVRPWPLDEVRGTLAALPQPWAGPWRLRQSGPLLVGWAGGEDRTAAEAPGLLWAGELVSPDAGGQTTALAAALAGGAWGSDFPLDGSFGSEIGPTAEAKAAAGRDLVHDTYALIERAVLRSVGGARRVGVPLSGGLDSRMLAAVLAKNGVPFRAYNMDFGDETPLARRVAETLGAPLRVLPLLEGLARNVPEAHDAVDCGYHVNQVWGWEMARRAAAEDGCDLLLDGLAFDTILGSVFHVGGDDDAALARALTGGYEDTYHPTMVSLAGPQAAATVQELLRTSMLEGARASIRAAGPRASDHFLMTNRIRRYTFGYCLANLHQVACGFPYVMCELFEHCLRLPIAERLEHNLYRRIYRELFPELARIPWAKTGLPLDRYGPGPRRGRWKIWLGALLRRLTLGRVALQGRDSFDVAFRKQAELREVFCKGLRADVWHLGALLPAEMATSTLSRELAGRDLGGVIQVLYTVENFLARHVDEGPVRLVG